MKWATTARNRSSARWPKYDFLPSGLFVWILLYDIVLTWAKRKSLYILPLAGMIGNWLTLMVATPTAFGVRYIYILVIGLPLLLAYPGLLERGK